MTTPTDADARMAGAAAPRWWRVGGGVREDVRTTVAVHERFARETAAALSRVARCQVDVAIATSEWMTFGEHVACLPEPVTVARVELPGAPSGMLLGIDSDIGLRLLDRLLGGAGAPPPQRPPTELEVELLGDVLGAGVAAVHEVFRPVLSSAPQMSQLTTQPQLLRLVALTERALVLTYRIGVDLSPAGEGWLSLCYPAGVVALLLGEVGESAALVDVQASIPGDPVLRHLAEDIEVELVARLQPSQVTADDLRRLRVGDVLTLDHRRDHALVLSIGGIGVLDGALGRRGRTMAVQVLHWRVNPANAVPKELS